MSKTDTGYKHASALFCATSSLPLTSLTKTLISLLGSFLALYSSILSNSAPAGWQTKVFPFKSSNLFILLSLSLTSNL